MSNSIKITDLPLATSSDTSDEVLIVKDGVTSRIKTGTGGGLDVDTVQGKHGGLTTGDLLIIGTGDKAALGLGTAAVLNAGSALGVATLDAGGMVPSAQLPALVITETFVVASEVAMLALTAQQGDVAIRTDTNLNYILRESPATVLSNWEQLRVALDPNIPSAGQKAALAGTSGTPSDTNRYATNDTTLPLEDFHAYRALKTYALNEPTFYLGVPYKSLQNANTGNTPDTSPLFWEITGGGAGAGSQAGYTFTNGQIEGNVVGYNTYANTAQALPVDGTGGSANVTFEASATLPLVGTGSGLFTKDAVNRQGQGFSKDFTIDRGLTGTPAQFQFLHESSSNFAYGDMGFYIYDITTGMIITPNNVLLPNTFGVPQVFISNFFPTKDVTAYRAIWHVASTSALDYTLKIDDITLGSKETIVAPAITDWQAYTPTFQGFGTPTTVDFKWRRDGSNIDVKGKFTAGTVTAVEAQIGLPSPYTSRADVSIIERVGNLSTTVDGSFIITALSEPSKTYMALSTSAVANGTLDKSLGTTFTTGATYSITASIPCAQFSVNTSFNGINEPMYLANRESVVNTNGVASKTISGMDGASFIANTVSTYYDNVLPRALQPNETPIIQVRSKIDGNWIDINEAIIPSLFCPMRSDYAYQTTGLGQQNGLFCAKTQTGILRVYQSNCLIGHTSFSPDAAAAVRTWASVIAAADGFDRWRIRIGQAGLSEVGGMDAGKNVNGYQKLPSGLILQWGITASSLGARTVTFPIPFPTACLSVTASGNRNADEGTTCTVKSYTTSSAVLYPYNVSNGGNAIAANWFAIGY